MYKVQQNRAENCEVSSIWPEICIFVCPTQLLVAKNAKMFQISAISLESCSWASSNYPLSAPHANWLLLFLHVVHKCLWSGAEPAQLIYSRAMLKGRAAWRTPAPEVINLPPQYVMGSEEGSVAAEARTFETAGKKVVNIPALRTFCLSTSVI